MSVGQLQALGMLNRIIKMSSHIVLIDDRHAGKLLSPILNMMLYTEMSLYVAKGLKEIIGASCSRKSVYTSYIRSISFL